MARVIVKFLDREDKTGDVLNFNMNSPAFSLQSEGKDGKPETHRIYINAVKAILFLKKEETGHLRTETIDQTVFAGTLAFKLVVEFKDGELIIGTTNRYAPQDKGFFLVPLNPGDISEKIYVNAAAVKDVDSKRLFGRILVEQKKITDNQLVQSLKQQKEYREKKIGAILVDASIISEKQLQESLRKQKEKSLLLGQILLEAGYITSEQLEYALSIQKKNRQKKLGQIFVELKFLTPADICIALATQFHCAWIDLSRVTITQETAMSLPEEAVRRLGVFPVERKRENVLVVATSQPQDSTIGTELIKLTLLSIEFVVAYEGYIEEAINNFYPRKK